MHLTSNESLVSFHSSCNTKIAASHKKKHQNDLLHITLTKQVLTTYLTLSSTPVKDLKRILRAILLLQIVYSMQIVIKTVSGRKRDFNLDDNLTVGDLKKSLMEKEGISPDQFRLIVKGKVMIDDKTLRSYQLTSGTVINMVLALRGGY